MARGFITRLKVKNVNKLTYDYEKAKLNELLGSMQQMVKGLDKHASSTDESPSKPPEQMLTPEVIPEVPEKMQF